MKMAQSSIILNPESLEDVRIATEIADPVHWVCLRDPQEVLGALVENFQGVYVRSAPTGIQIVFRTGSSSTNEPEIYSLPSSSRVSIELLEAVCAARLGGVPASQVQELLAEGQQRARQQESTELERSFL
jgi:hypothetical protein